MGERTSYPPGTFSWAELATTDAEAAKSFYTDLFGWEYDDRKIPDDGVYSMALLGGKSVAALFSSAGQPPRWNSYVTVASADDATMRAQDAGAEVIAEPFDVMDAGRMAVFSDPTGAVLSIWEPGGNIGAELINTSGSMTWNDLVTSDPDTAAAFYRDVFGWRIEEVPDAGGYRVIYNGERGNGGIFPREDAPPMWVPYFGHDDVERLARDLGERTLAGPMPMWQGRIATFADPQGAVFCVWSGHYDD
jgi:predicted enzyme related to lactoylglutathione lyase